jgi:hypothetical protein
MPTFIGIETFEGEGLGEEQNEESNSYFLHRDGEGTSPVEDSGRREVLRRDAQNSWIPQKIGGIHLPRMSSRGRKKCLKRPNKTVP